MVEGNRKLYRAWLTVPADNSTIAFYVSGDEALTLWVAGADPRAWWHWLLALVALAAWFGAVTDTVTMVRALVRRRRPSDPPR